MNINFSKQRRNGPKPKQTGTAPRNAVWITWQHRDIDFKSPYSFDDKVTIFRERLWGWYLHVARLCINGGKSHDRKKDVASIPHAGFAVLMLTLSYFELIARHYRGCTNKKDVRKYFEIGLKKVFPELHSGSPNVAPLLSLFYERLYKGARNGLYHNSQTAPGIILSGDPRAAFTYCPEQESVRINPHLIPQILIDHLDQYCEELRTGSNSKLRENFEKRFDYELSLGNNRTKNAPSRHRRRKKNRRT